MEPEPRYVGIDVAKARLEVAVRPTGEGGTSPYDEAAVQGLVSQLEQLEPVMVLLEASGGLEVPLVAAPAAGHADPGSQLPGCPQTPGDGPAGLGEESPGVRQGRRTSQDRGAHRLAQRGAGGAGQWAWAGPAPESGMAREGGVAAHGSLGGTATLLDPTGLSAGTGGPGPKGDLRPGGEPPQSGHSSLLPMAAGGRQAQETGPHRLHAQALVILNAMLKHRSPWCTLTHQAANSP